MKKIILIPLTILIASATVLCSLLGACTHALNIKDYPATDTEFRYELDSSIPLISPANAHSDNHCRGFRGETYITLGRDEAYPDSGESYISKLEYELRRLEPDGIKIMQVYVYLIEYYNTDIPDSALNQLKDYLELIESKGIKILLRFAYETTEGQKIGPRTKDIERHCSQLKVFFQDNLGLFNRTVYAAQLGMIGLWGEGHGSAHRHNVSKVIRAVADMIPENTPIMVRTPEMLSEVPSEIESRFSLHEDYVIGYNDPWVAIQTDSPYYGAVVNKCKHSVTDGEMPWGRANLDIDMIGCIRTCVDYGFTSFSIAHNYTEEGEYHLKKWQSLYLTEDILKENRFPYNPALLSSGKISVFDYLKYHLGYQLVASNLEIEDGKATFMITNFGFAAPHGYEIKLYVDGAEVTPILSHDCSELTQFSQLKFTAPYTLGELSIAIVNKRDASDTIRLFNDIPFSDGKNIIVANS
ncbi:MAG: DUF4874 domain-containing protein [Clostridia bacterium]|nr:DUF4874 domain-containing protein [Clostridia bacterium]